MKTPLRQVYAFGNQGRYLTTDEPYQVDLSGLLEAGETMTDITVTALNPVAGLVDRVSMANAVVTFWVSEGSTAGFTLRLRLDFTSSFTETDSILCTIPVLS